VSTLRSVLKLRDTMTFFVIFLWSLVTMWGCKRFIQHSLHVIYLTCTNLYCIPNDAIYQLDSIIGLQYWLFALQIYQKFFDSWIMEKPFFIDIHSHISESMNHLRPSISYLVTQWCYVRIVKIVTLHAHIELCDAVCACRSATFTIYLIFAYNDVPKIGIDYWSLLNYCSSIIFL